MTIGEDGRPYIAVRRRQRQDIQGSQTLSTREEERNEVCEEEEVTKVKEEEDKEMENLIRDYQENARPNAETLKLLRFYGEGDWRQDKGVAIQRFICRRLEIELVNEYQRDAEPMEEVKCILEEQVGN